MRPTLTEERFGEDFVRTGDVHIYAGATETWSTTSDVLQKYRNGHAVFMVDRDICN